jgi:hypothetical protein
VKRIALVLSAFIAIGVLALGSVSLPSATAGDLDRSALSETVLTNPSIHLRTSARSDAELGLVDARVLAVLLYLAERHDLTSVGPLVSAHSYYVKGTTHPSNHAFGRAVDITAVDGSPVSLLNEGALDALRMLESLQSPLRPDEIGAPWPVRFEGISTFTKDHADHLHIGFSEGRATLDL